PSRVSLNVRNVVLELLRIVKTVELFIDQLCRLFRRRRRRLVGLLRQRNTHPHGGAHFAAEFSRGRVQHDDLAAPTVDSVAESSADRAVVGAIKHKAALAVRKPDGELYLSIGHLFLSYVLDLEPNFVLEIFGSEEAG